jgi:hypothetical protein
MIKFTVRFLACLAIVLLFGAADSLIEVMI